MKIKTMSMEDVEMAIGCLERQLKKDKFKPDVIIGIGKGGLIPAVFLANYFNAELKVFITKHYHNKKKTESVALIQRPIFSFVSAKDKYLIVDDIADSGETIKAVVDYLDEHLPLQINIRTATIHYKETSYIKPDYYFSKTDKWVKYPWER